MSNELSPANHAEYNEIISIIERARENAFRAVNRELISMNWEIGKYVSDKVKSVGWGKAVVKDFSKFIQSANVKQFFSSCGKEFFLSCGKQFLLGRRRIFSFASDTAGSNEQCSISQRRDVSGHSLGGSRTPPPAA